MGTDQHQAQVYRFELRFIQIVLKKHGAKNTNGLAFEESPHKPDQMNRLLKLLSSFAAIAAFGLPLQAQDETPIIPVGTLSAYPTIVQAGTHPTITWDITIPETFDKVVDIVGDGTLTPNRDLVMDVRVVGVGVEDVNPDGTVEDLPVEVRVEYGGSTTPIFIGTNDSVKPNKVLYSGPVSEGSTIDFSSRWWDETWGPLQDSADDTPTVVSVRNGDTPPSTNPMLSNPGIEQYILPYLDENGNINLGEREVLVLFELTETDQTSNDFDLVDCVILVTFYDERNNNGHGNNTDGVDSSNPGKSKQGQDTDPTVDDEEKVRGNRKK